MLIMREPSGMRTIAYVLSTTSTQRAGGKAGLRYHRYKYTLPTVQKLGFFFTQNYCMHEGWSCRDGGYSQCHRSRFRRTLLNYEGVGSNLCVLSVISNLYTSFVYLSFPIF